METLEECRNRIQAIRKQIVEGESRSEDTSKLGESLKRARLEEKTIQDAEINDAEFAELRIMAAQRSEWQKAAQSISERVSRQNEAIAHFMKARDGVTIELLSVIEKLRPLVEAQEACYTEFENAAAFNNAVAAIPKGYLPAVTCHNLATNDGKIIGLHLSNLSLVEDFESWRELLDNIIKTQETVTTQNEVTGDPDAGTSEDTNSPARSCVICEHPQREAIDKALADGVSLRDIEAQYPGASRYSLSRHKQHAIMSQEIMQEVT